VRNNFEEGVLKFILILDKLRINYAIIGAVATGIYGIPRTTYDVDIILDIEKIKFIPFVEMLQDGGFDFNKEHLLKELKEGYLSEVYYKNIRIDIFLPILPYFNHVIKRAIIFKLWGNELKFATAEDLIILKLISDRESDIKDVERIKDIQVNLDVQYIEDWLKKLIGLKHPSFKTFQQIFEK
jgi:predicted nucleotidyltransferase